MTFAYEVIFWPWKAEPIGRDRKKFANRVQGLCHEIEKLRKADQEQRLGRQSQVSWDSEKQHEARVARMDEIKEELVKLGRGTK